MKTKRVIWMLILILTLLLVSCTVSTNTFAANSSYVLGITNVREFTEQMRNEGKTGGAAYGIGAKAGNTVTKKIWKIISYSGTGSDVVNYNNAFYCIKAEHGFVTNSTTRKCIKYKKDI